MPFIRLVDMQLKVIDRVTVLISDNGCIQTFPPDGTTNGIQTPTSGGTTSGI